MSRFLIIGGLIVFLIAGLFSGYPIEINQFDIDRAFFGFSSVLIVGVFILLLLLILKIKSKGQRLIGLIVLTPLSLIYLLIGLWSYFISYDDGPRWIDIIIYSNKKGDKVVSQFRETSGSIHDYRYRFVIGEFNRDARISINWSKNKMHGVWIVRDLKRDSTYSIDLDMKNN